MLCPKCKAQMNPVEFGTDIRILRCQGCQGLYCDNGMLELLRKQWMSDTVLDTGSAADGARLNSMEDVQCPSCHTTMERVKDSEQPHIILDVCPSCEGVFLDAGELTDMKRVTLIDYLKQIFARS